MRKSLATTATLGLVILIAAGVLAMQIPALNQRISWRVDIALTYLRGMIHPAGNLPTPLAQALNDPGNDLPPPAVAVTRHPTLTPALLATPTPATPEPTPLPTFTPTPIPAEARLPSPAWEKQEPNNCGPATLTMYLRMFGWEGNQKDISDLLKPQTDDRNVNVDELIYFVRTRVGWLNAEFRVGGNLQLLKNFLAAGLPVVIEEGMHLDATYWPNDDHWAGHYLLLNGYDDGKQTFTAQDSFIGADQNVPYSAVQKNWQAFNYVYILLYRNEQADTVKSILGENWDPEANRQHALDLAQSETRADPENAFAWFNLGSNLVYFEKYGDAARSYDTARNLGLPQRMLRYQFGPFFAYFFSGRNDDLLALTEYALQRTPNSEETLLWRGWGLYRQGKKNDAVDLFQRALQENPFYQDAKYALDFVRENP